MAEPSDNSRNVFVVYGRNLAARNAMFTFLRSLDLKPLEWNQIVQAINTPSPYTGDILKIGFEMAQAAVVLMTPDDEARLKPEFWKDDDKDDERKHTGQPRQNVLFEAGMALGAYEQRAILVELGQIRTMSDTLGRYVIKMDGSTVKRQELLQRLETAGCRVDRNGTDWQNMGDFQAAIAGNASPDLSGITDKEPNLQSAPSAPGTSEDSKPPLDALDFVRLGEQLWYLTSPPYTHVNNVTSTIRSFLVQLDKCGLKAPRNVASTLETVDLIYDLRTNAIRDSSREIIGLLMKPIRQSLESEIRK